MPANLGYRLKGQNKVPPHQSSGERENRASCREESAEDSEERTEETAQGPDLDKTERPPARHPTCPEGAVVSLKSTTL